jgi:hypothetical protein
MMRVSARVWRVNVSARDAPRQQQNAQWGRRYGIGLGSMPEHAPRASGQMMGRAVSC